MLLHQGRHAALTEWGAVRHPGGANISFTWLRHHQRRLLCALRCGLWWWALLIFVIA